MSGRFVDLDRWKRREHFRLFRHAGQPFFSITVNADVTGIVGRGGSFLLGGLFHLLRALQATEALRLRLHGDGVWLHDRVGIGTTILRPDETFGFARFDLTPTYEEFREIGEAAVERVKSSAELDPMPGRDDLVYHSSLPWLRFTSFTNALSGSDSIPRITFGKYFADGASWRMPLAVEVHHALVDGLDVARLVEAFENSVNGR